MSNPFVNGLLFSRLKAAEIAASVAGDLRRSTVAEVLADAEEIHAWITATPSTAEAAAVKERKNRRPDPKKYTPTHAAEAVLKYVKEQNREGVEPSKRDVEGLAAPDMGRGLIRDAVQDLTRSGALELTVDGRRHKFRVPDNGAACDECQRLYGWHDPGCSSYVPDTRTLREKIESIR